MRIELKTISIVLNRSVPLEGSGYKFLAKLAVFSQILWTPRGVPGKLANNFIHGGLVIIRFEQMAVDVHGDRERAVLGKRLDGLASAPHRSSTKPQSAAAHAN
jgi:hypothetical protein